MSNAVIDLDDYKKKKQEFLKVTKVNSLNQTLDYNTLCNTVHVAADIIEEQSEILELLIQNQKTLNDKFKEMQGQFLYVSGQAFMLIEMLKAKNICTGDEIESLWQKILKENIVGQPEKDEESVSDSSVETPNT